LKIVILGAGQVGSSVAENLLSEANDITVVDIDGTRLRNLQDRLDLRTVLGSAAHPSVLVEAGIEDCDMMIAVTQSDETNLVACKLAQQLFNVPTRIVRLRATDYLSNERVLGPDCFDVDLAICPEQILTDYIVKLIEFPEALQVLEFAHGKVSLPWTRASPPYFAETARFCPRAIPWCRPEMKCFVSPRRKTSARSCTS
jgi:trk system potassium uptake protein TrkA